MTDELMDGEQTTSDDVSKDAANLTWHEANQCYLTAAMSGLRARLQTALGKHASAPPPEATLQAEVDAVLDPAAWTFSQPPALEQLCSSFALSSFERGVLLLAAGAEMDARLAELYSSLDGSRRPLPTVNLALTSLPDAHWSALSPARALRYWQLIELLPADTLVSGTFRINERILHFLAGVSGLDERLQHLVRAVPQNGALPSSYSEIAQQVATVWADAARRRAASSAASQLPVIELCGTEPDANRAIAAAAAGSLDLRLYTLSPRNFPQSDIGETDLLIRLWEREAVLSGTALLLEAEDIPAADAPSSATLSHLVESLHTPLILSARQPQPTLTRPRAVFYTGKPTRAEQAQLWRHSLPDQNLDGTVEALVGQFSLAPVAIRSAAHRADSAAHQRRQPHLDLTQLLWDACRIEARPRLEGLAQRIEPHSTWNDLVLPEKEQDQLRHIALHVRHRTQVYETWGFADRSSRGLGISALFAGPSGTGKTTAAEVLAYELRLDLFRIDLSQVISKYIGETEKNLSRVFDAAEQGAAVLLFDEADALFGKRTEVKDSHDRYANVEVSYLLQRMEAYRGLAILTTNRKTALDAAFLRRIRFVVEFPFPEVAQRAEMWRHIFPPRTPTDGLNIERLARLRVSGGNIHNIAMGAAFLAADSGQPVRMEHVLAATRTEFTKLETPLNDAEVAGWL
jgi:hypothetical protein